MVNTGKVNKILADGERYLKELEGLLPVDLKTLDQNLERRYSIAFLLEQIINECINLGNHIVSEKDLGVVETFKEIFEKLAKANLISEKTAEGMEKLVEIRNIIAHRYGRFSNEDVLEALKKRRFIEKFLNEIIRKIQ